MKSSKVSIKTRSPPASLSFKGQATKHTTVKWSIVVQNIFSDYQVNLQIVSCNFFNASCVKIFRLFYALVKYVSRKHRIGPRVGFEPTTSGIDHCSAD